MESTLCSGTTIAIRALNCNLSHMKMFMQLSEINVLAYLPFNSSSLSCIHIYVVRKQIKIMEYKSCKRNTFQIFPLHKIYTQKRNQYWSEISFFQSCHKIILETYSSYCCITLHEKNTTQITFITIYINHETKPYNNIIN